MLVTGGGEGPLVVSIGIASAAAAAGTRTALVECDLARPALADALGLNPAPGLHEYLRRDAEAPDILQPLVLAGPASANASGPLVCVVGGEPGPDGATPIAGPDFRHAVSKLRRAYDLVVLHGPPLGDISGALPAAAERVRERDRLRRQ